MMHQQPPNVIRVRSRRPNREKIIQRDEIVSLQIDLQVLTAEEFLRKYLDTEVSDLSNLKYRSSPDQRNR